MRRQNSSCDQCRKGKRACDAAAVKDVQAGLDHESQLDINWPDLSGPCSTCLKTGKRCTFNWVRSQQLQIRERRQSSSTSTSASEKRPLPMSRKRAKSAAAAAAASASAAAHASPLPSSAFVGDSETFQSFFNFLDPNQPNFILNENSCMNLDDNYMDMRTMMLAEPVFPSTNENFTLSPTTETVSTDTIADDWSLFLSAPPGGISDELPGLDERDAIQCAHDPSSIPMPEFAPQSQPINSSSKASMHPRSRKRTWRGRHEVNFHPHPYPHPQTHGIISAFSPTQKMISRTNNALMTDNLMKLYHDVMEGALSCWLTEQNCPYLTLSKSDTENLGCRIRDVPPPESGFPTKNRIYQRVVKLDKAIGSFGIKPLTASENRKATTALHLSIMAFTAQWAQGSRRSRARYNNATATTLRNDYGDYVVNDDDPSSSTFSLSEAIGEEFDTTLQVSFWNQARKHLDDCSEVDSFKVAFAELVFGLTQKHYIIDHTQESLFPESDSNSMAGRYNGIYLTQRIKEAIARNEHNVYMDRGARRLHVLKRRVDYFGRRRRSSTSNQSGPGQAPPSMSRTDAIDTADSEERRTLELIFWLAVMFDTLTAAMTERPLAVSDEDSKDSFSSIREGREDKSGATNTSSAFASASSKQTSLSSSASSFSSSEWNDHFIIKRHHHHHQKLSSLRWPCPEDAIARDLRDAAPVKVLLFRKITRLQTLSARGAGPQALETAVQDALSVCRHWNMTYGPLFQDCLQHHDSLPPTVQSWYVCLLGHWLLAVMMLGDAIRWIDDQGLGLSFCADKRAKANVVGHLRGTSCRMVSDLARASTPRHINNDDDNDAVDDGRLAGYHHAANEGALLTEPWTMVLIRSFAMAGLSLLDEAEGGGGVGIGREEAGMGVSGEDLLVRCERCVKALWYLGRKSCLAREVAELLGEGLDRARLGGGLGMEGSWRCWI